MQITAQQIKTRGTAVIEEQINENGMIILSVRGRPKYVIMGIDEYDKYREVELDRALIEAKQDIESGNYSEGINNHIELLNNGI